jgi:hypothetical protein
MGTFGIFLMVVGAVTGNGILLAIGFLLWICD